MRIANTKRKNKKLLYIYTHKKQNKYIFVQKLHKPQSAKQIFFVFFFCATYTYAVVASMQYCISASQ